MQKRIQNNLKGKGAFILVAMALILTFSSISASAFESEIASGENWPAQYTHLEKLSGMADYDVYGSEKDLEVSNIKSLVELPQL